MPRTDGYRTGLINTNRPGRQAVTNINGLLMSRLTEIYKNIGFMGDSQLVPK